MTTNPPPLDSKLKHLPTSTGVYLFKDALGKIIYIGKAKNLRNRVRSYFRRAAHHTTRTSRLVSHVVDFELLVTENEIEALILEANLVKEHKPRYNVMLKDDKHFPYVKITTNEPFPRVFIVRRLEKDGATYFGPYTSGVSVRRTLALLCSMFKIRSCNLTIPHPTGKKQQVCLDYHMNRCGGPCEGLQSEEEYSELVNSVIMVLSGKSRKLVRDLEAKMKASSARLKFEEATVYRDQIDAIEKMMLKQNVDIGELVDRDIISLAREENDAVAVVMQLREGVLIGRQDFQLSCHKTDSPEQILETFVSQYYNRQPNLPGEVILPLSLPDVKLFAEWLKSIRGSKVKVVIPQRGQKIKLVDLAGANARLLLDELMIQKKKHAERTSKMVTALKDALGLVVSPRRIICFDISNTGETDAVGSGVVFVNARPRKSDYRKFKIKGVTGQDDFKMMREIVGRYFHRLSEEDGPVPDLVVVDGGKGQLSAVCAELASLKMNDQPVISLAKRLEEVFVPGQSDAITISRGSPALILLKQVRDEAHRFAITYNRKVRSKRTIGSELDRVAGVGPVLRVRLLRKFGSVKKIKQLSTEEISAVEGVSLKLAQEILQSL